MSSRAASAESALRSYWAAVGSDTCRARDRAEQHEEALTARRALNPASLRISLALPLLGQQLYFPGDSIVGLAREYRNRELRCAMGRPAPAAADDRFAIENDSDFEDELELEGRGREGAAPGGGGSRSKGSEDGSDDDDDLLLSSDELDERLDERLGIAGGAAKAGPLSALLEQGRRKDGCGSERGTKRARGASDDEGEEGGGAGGEAGGAGEGEGGAAEQAGEDVTGGKKKKRKVVSAGEAMRVKEASARRGVLYISRIPPHMKPAKIRQLLQAHGEIGRLYCAPEDKALRRSRKKAGKDTGKNFTEGWVEFEDKRVAKRIAAQLNGQNIGGKRRSKYYYDLWCLKYLPKFKWDHLTEEINYQRAVREQRLAAEISSAKRERDFYLSRVDRAKAVEAIADRKAAKAASGAAAVVSGAGGGAAAGGSGGGVAAKAEKPQARARFVRQVRAHDEDAAPALGDDVLALIGGRAGGKRVRK
ncbi:hypothetical protein FOA52_000807 [Chlamydomonas sp. UWO 241]|nr:hypothetical protein FOA52_000807 [Chlamydomonas sp. UWO 241]